MLFFALWHRSAVDDAQSASGPHGQKGPTGSLVAESNHSSPLPLRHPRRFGLASYTLGVSVCRRGTVLLNVRHHQTRFWLHTGETIESKPPFDMSDLFKKASTLLDTGQGALESIQGATDNINLITGKINSGQGTVGKLVNDTTLYKQAAAGVASLHDDADALQHNFLLRGFFKDRGYGNPAEITEHEIPQLPREQPVKSFVFDPKNLFDKTDSAKLKNEKSLKQAGQFLQDQKFGLAVISVSTGNTGDSEKARVLSEARGFVVRKYIVENFPLYDTRLKTLALGKNAAASADGSIEILIYGNTPKAPRTPAAHGTDSK